MTPAAALTESEAAAWSAFQRMRARVGGALSRELGQATGLSEADFEVLVAVAEQPDGRLRALALRCGLEWEKSRLSHQLRRMEQRGLVRRESCREDGRGSVVVLTEEGRRLAATARRRYDEAVRRHVIDALTPEQVEALRDICDTLFDHVEAGPHT
jgi:DNA-binding MarR family transcriptional regulator